MTAFFAIFLFSSTFSIALSQATLGVAAAIFLFQQRAHLGTMLASNRGMYVAIGLWVSWLVITSMMSDTPGRSLLGIREAWLFVIIPLGMYLSLDEQRGQLLIGALAVGIIAIGLYGIFQYFTGIAWFSHYDLVAAPGFGYRVMGRAAGYVTFASFFGVASCLLYGYTISGGGSGNSRFCALLWSAIGLGLLVTFLSFGRAAIGATGLTIVIISLLAGPITRWRTLVVPLGLALLLVAIPGSRERFIEGHDIDFGGDNVKGRIVIWETSLRVVDEQPIFGVGQGNFQSAYAEFLPDDTPERLRFTHAHNDFIHIAAIAGWPGLALFCLLWGVPLWLMIRGLIRSRLGRRGSRWYLLMAGLSGSLCFLGVSLFHGTFGDEEVRCLLMYSWALGLVGRYTVDREYESIS